MQELQGTFAGGAAVLLEGLFAGLGGPPSCRPAQREVSGRLTVGNANRAKRNALREEEALSEVTDQWMSAVEIAFRLRMPYQRVAFALRRLVAQERVEMMVRKVPGKGRTTDDQAVYRVPNLPRAMLPHWLMPRVPEFRVLKKRIIRHK